MITRFRDSLRFRILMSFIVIGAVLGPLVAGSLLWVTHQLEERAVMRMTADRLDAVIRNPDAYQLETRGIPPGVQVLVSTDASGLADDILMLPDGIHEHHTEQGAWMVALESREGARYAVVSDITALDKREDLIAITLGAGTLLAIMIAAWLGFYMSRRLLAPLRELSQWATHATGPHMPRPPVAALAPDEVGTLGHALDRYARLMHQALTREREFSANVSHELRTPITIIQNAAELIELDRNASTKTRDAATRIVSATRRLADTVTVLMMLARDPADRRADEQVDVSDVVAAMLDELRKADPETTRHVQCEVHARPSVLAPPIVVEAISQNLLHNALQHAGASRIDIAVYDHRLEVRDDGVGINAEELPRVMERGIRGSSATGDGSGLGLALVHQLCTRYGWRLMLRSDSPGGTRVVWHFGEAGEGTDTPHMDHAVKKSARGRPSGS
ncbi:MAG: sensor histidine kinase [Gammaproteobacteria bacterium]|nr:MAG: sensor histidine kinase [Gammaproteobacteria bacterium]